jgi:hypothetical protein
MGWGRRASVGCGLAFVLAGGGLAVWLQQPGRITGFSPVPVALHGRVTSRVSGASANNRWVMVRHARQPAGRIVSYFVMRPTDDSGRFVFAAHFQSPAHFYLARSPTDPWTYRPLLNVSLPASGERSIELIEGVTVRGRVLQAGYPVSGLTVCLAPARRDAASFAEVEATVTGYGGKFAFRHLFEESPYEVSASLGRPPDRHTLVRRSIRTERDGSTLDMGDLFVEPAASRPRMRATPEATALPQFTQAKARRITGVPTQENRHAE